MIKTEEFVKQPGSTMFFPKIIVTKEEMDILYNGTVDLAWMRLVVNNCNEFEYNMNKKRKGPTSAERYRRIVNEWSWKWDILIADVDAFSKGQIDLVDMVVKYGVPYKKCKQFIKDALYAAGKETEIDADQLWKLHKKFAQRNTTLALYGVEHTAMREEVQAKRIETNRRIYGADNPMQIPEIKEKLRKRILKEHGVEYTFMKRTSVSEWHKKVFQCLTSDSAWTKILSEQCDQAGRPFAPDMFADVLPLNRRDFVISELCNTHVENLLKLWKDETGSMAAYPDNVLFCLPFTFSKTWLRHYEKLGLVKVPELFYSSLSIYEKNMEHFLNGLGVKYLRNHKKTLHGLEMDFYIPDKHIGIEINPNISHNSNLYATEPKRSMFSSHKQPSYHYDKYQVASKEGVTLLQLFANDIEPLMFERVTSKRLKSLLLGYDEVLYARNIEVRQVLSDKEKKQARAFMDEHHSQGSSRASAYWVFMDRHRMVGVASFSPFHIKGHDELKRLCFAPGTQVIGGLSKLVNHYLKENTDCAGIYSYSDNSMGNGMSYNKAGAEFVKETGPALKFLSPHNGMDSYSWQIATRWGADCGVIAKDAERKGLSKPSTQDEINAYIETELSHRFDDLKGYDRIYTPGSKLWKFIRKE